ncbi:MAG: DUF1285 domain-containing protein [Pseudomonadota bacterium]
MTDLMRYAAMLDGEGQRRLPPVEKWSPEYCGEMDLAIRRDGVWVHEGTPIGRARLVRLLSTVIRKDGDRYFLVTPVEKLGIKVEDAPFLAVLMRTEGEGADRRLVFTTNVGEEVIAGPDHPISYRASAGGKAPYIHVRAGLDALISRAVFYDLVAIGETRDIGGELWFGVKSAGEFFAFGQAGDIFAAQS